MAKTGTRRNNTPKKSTLATIKRRSKKYRTPVKQNVNNLRSLQSSMITNGRQITRGTGLNIAISCTSSTKSPKRPKRKRKKNQQARKICQTTLHLPDGYKTLDQAGDTSDDDVIVVTEFLDDDIVYISDTESCKEQPSVIVIEDDSILEAPLPSEKYKDPSAQTANRIIQRRITQVRPKILNNNNHVANGPSYPPSPIANVPERQLVPLAGFSTSTPARNGNNMCRNMPDFTDTLARMQINPKINPNFPQPKPNLPEPKPNLPEPKPNLPEPKPKIPERNQNDPYRAVVKTCNTTRCRFELRIPNFANVGHVRTTGLRPIFIDGSNIAMGHGRGNKFSIEGLKICIDYFISRQHEVTAIVPQFRKKFGLSTNYSLLRELEKRGLIIFTPSRSVLGRNIVPYDDRYVVLLAHVYQGIIVSSDNYRDLLDENPSLLDTIQNRILNPTWVRDMLIFPSDPLGKNGPNLDEFLRFP